MKKIYFLAFLFLCTFLTIGTNTAWGETKQGSWDLTQTPADWIATGNEAYFGQPYGFKKADGTLTNKSIADFSISGITEIKVGFKCLQNGGNTSKITIWLVDKDGQPLGAGTVVTPKKANQATQTDYNYATFTTNLSNATGFMMKVTTFGKNILVNGAEYTVTYTTTPLPKHTITWSMPDGTNTTQVTEGSAIGTLPADPSAPSGCSDKVFVGWTATNIGATPTNNKPDFITANTVPAGNTTYYAVFATKSGSGAGEEYEWTTYSDWGIKQTSWLRNNNATLPTLSYTPTYKVEKIVLNVKQSNSKGSNSIEVRIGGETFGSKVASLSGTAAYDITFQGLEAETGKIEIICTNTSGSGTGKGTFYLNSITLYEEGISYSSYITECIDCTASTEALALTLSQETANLGQDGNAVVTFSTTGGNGTAVTYAVTPTTGATLNGTTVTFTQEGTYTLTASQTYTTTNGTTYCGGTDSKKIVITKTPTLYFTTTPADPIVFGTVECGGNTPLTDKQTISLRGYNLTGDVTVTVTGDYKIADTESAALADYTTSLTLPKDAVSGSSASVYVLSTPPMQSSSPTTGKVIFTTAGGNTLEVNLSTSDITCTEYTLTLNDRGTTSSAGNYLAGASVPKPADPTGVCTNPINYIFDGWATAEVAEGSTAYTKVSFPYTMPAANTTLYAVYKYEGNTISDTQFKRGTLDDLVDGQKVVIVEQDAKKALNSKTYQSYYLTATAVTINNDLIDVTNNALIWELKKNGSNYSFLQDGKYLNITESSTHYNLTVTSQEDSWSIVAFGDGYSLQSTTYADYYAVYNSKYTEYTTDKTAYALQFYVPVAIQEYTTAPSCTPCIKGTDDITVTSAKGVWVEAVTPLNITATNLDKNADGAKVTITATSLTDGFTLKTQGTNGSDSESVTLETGYSNSIYNANLTVVYSPTADNIIEKGEIALRVCSTNGTSTYATDTIIVRGRSLPAEFVLAAETTNGWVALPADLGTSSTDAVKEPYTISVDDNAAPTKATLAPQSALYSAAMRSTVNTIPTGLRFAAGEKYLRGSQSEGENKVWLSSSGSEQMQLWELHSSNLADYFVRLHAAEAGRYLSYNATQGKIANYKQESRLRILPVENICVRFDAPKLVVHTLTSTSATLRWEEIAGVNEYEYSLNEGNTWATCNGVQTMGTAIQWTLGGLETQKQYTIWVRAKVADGETNCSDYDTETFTTTNCDDVPIDLLSSATANSVTITWKAQAATATVKIYSDEEGKNEVKSVQNLSSPAKIMGLAPNTKYYFQVLADGSCASAIDNFLTESNEVSIVEWKKDAVIVDLNTEVTDADEVSILVEGQKTHGTNNNVADDLFFSKYYEATGNVKLVAIFNGTKDTLSLANIKIHIGQEAGKSSTNTQWDRSISLQSQGKFKEGFIAPNEEIILWCKGSSNVDKSIISCVDGKMNVNIMKEEAQVVFGGRQTIALSRNGEIIDIMGAVSTNDADITKSFPMKGNCRPTWGDMKSDEFTWCGTGYSIEDKTTEIELSMNRCLLVRNKVKSGANAVANNVGAFNTFTKDEWLGRPVEEGSDNGITESCNGFAYVADFNYNDYYTTYDSITNLEIKGNRNEDGTYTIPIPKLDTMACTNLRLQLKKKGTIQATREEKVPIIIYKTTDTKNSEFFGEKLTDEVCATCDVVVRDNAQLSHIAGGKQQFRDMYVYTGSSLNIPENQTMSLDKVRMFATNNNVSYAVINNSNDAAAAISVKEVSHVKRIDGRYWYPFSLPYDCNIADIDQLNGQPLGVYGTDWGIKYYDGQRRQSEGNSTTHYGEVSKYWTMMPEDGQLKAYTGYIIGLFVPAADEPLMKSVNFPPATESAYTENADSKTTHITNWSDNLTAKPRHHGWNFVGSPYISLFGLNNNTQGEGLYNTNVKMGYTDAFGNQQDKEYIYVSIPNGGNSNTYTQALASGVTILPFSAYFVQAIDPTNGQSNTLELTYSKSQGRLPTSAPARTAKTDALILTELDITNGALGDNTGVLVSNVYSAEYEIGDDLTKMYAAAQKPQLYTIDAHNDKMAYQALPDVLAHAIPLGIYVPQAGDYTLSLNRYVSRLEAAEAVYLLHNGAVVANLLQSDYIVSASAKGTISGYSLDIRRAPEVVTDFVPAAGDAPYIIARDGVLAIANLPADAIVQVYDVLGHRLLQTDTHAAGTLQVPVPQTGVYTVVITTADGQQVLKTLLR